MHNDNPRELLPYTGHVSHISSYQFAVLFPQIIYIYHFVYSREFCLKVYTINCVGILITLCELIKSLSRFDLLEKDGLKDI